ncbi:T9SS type A sorting domain-containing protein [uncultured Dokdonia sp.]|uniref:T9SS type A sorting domain-containing protein n=1 Tax=uncultured Dokdonia sp. TaxID=575653 RepID=UPI00262A8189|nr:T9SS type A sorting domain-containing protein [uncultured Dokdonia sp.]
MKNLFTILCIFSFMLSNAQNYQSAESVAYDEANDRWLVANGSNIIIDDGNGNLSVFGTMSATHGMEIIGNILYALDSNVLRGYDLDTAAQVMSLSISGVGFLNGMANNGVDQLYVTDFSLGDIHQIDVSDIDNPTSTILTSNAGTSPNGILFDGDNNRLLFVTFTSNASIRQLDLTNNSVSDVIADTGLGNIDGIIYSESLDEFYVSSWNPAAITRYTSDFSESAIIDVPSINNPADIDIKDVGGTVTIGIPIFNNVLFADVEDPLAIEEAVLDSIQFSLSENPITSSSIISFTLQEASQVSMSVYSIDGKLIRTLFSENNSIGEKQVSLESSSLARGMYLLNITLNGQVLSKKILVN